MTFIACAMLRDEIEQAFRDMGLEDEVIYIEAALHVDFDKLKRAITSALDETGRRGGPVGMIFGSKCHPDIVEMTRARGAAIAPDANCLEMLLGGHMADLDAECRTFYLSCGWLKHWRELFECAGRDNYDVRQSMGYYDRCVLIDTGVGEIRDEDQLEFFEYCGVPIDTYETDLGYFRGRIKMLMDSDVF